MFWHLFSCASQDEIFPGPYPIREPNYNWESVNPADDKLPRNLFNLGKIESGENAYVARGVIDGERVPGYMLKSTRMAYMAHKNEEHKLPRFEVMVVNYGKSELCWESDTNCKNYNSIALKAGLDNRELTLIGRTFESNKDKICRPGKVHRSEQKLCVPLGGQEVKYSKYETLVVKSSPASLFKICCWNIINEMTICGKNSKQNVENLPLPGYLKSAILNHSENANNDGQDDRRPVFISY